MGKFFSGFFKIAIPMAIAALISYFIYQATITRPDYLPELPAPELSSGERGTLGIDKNINETTIDQYLRRSDSVYYDMRMLEDPANYSAIGGNSDMDGYVRGFEVIPLPYLMDVSEILPESVGTGYTGPTLYDKNYKANYTESDKIMKSLFPKDKYIFLMCGGGGYANATKKLLTELGWNKNLIYNVGGYWNYEGKNKVELSSIYAREKTGVMIGGIEMSRSVKKYDYTAVPYHVIQFDKLTPVSKD